ncbi:Multidrug resistance-associated protein 1, partial [Dissophora globulifera]
IELKSGLIGLIYQKSFLLTPGARQRSTIGEISNHMSVDCERVVFAVMAPPHLITSTFEICVGIWLLYVHLGPSSLTSVGVVILIMPIQWIMGKLLNRAKSKKLETMDNRIRVLNELLSAMKTIKMYSWEEAFYKRIARFRKTEIKQLRSIGVAWAISCIMFSSLPLVMSLLTFVVYSLVGGPQGSRGVLTPQIVFVSIALFARLSQPLGRLSGITSQIITLNVCLKRIQVYLTEKELDPNQIEYIEEMNEEENRAAAISIQDGEFAWSTAFDEKKKREAAREALKQKQKEAGTTGKDTANTERIETAATPPMVNSTLNNNINNNDHDDDDIKEPLSTLSNINIEVSKGSLAMIVGRVGQGKSSLMSAMIGEMYKRQGRVQVSGSIAYVPQQAWILNASLRDNILF